MSEGKLLILTTTEEKKNKDLGKDFLECIKDIPINRKSQDLLHEQNSHTNLMAKGPSQFPKINEIFNKSNDEPKEDLSNNSVPNTQLIIKKRNKKKFTRAIAMKKSISTKTKLKRNKNSEKKIKRDEIMFPNSTKLKRKCFENRIYDFRENKNLKNAKEKTTRQCHKCLRELDHGFCYICNKCSRGFCKPCIELCEVKIIQKKMLVKEFEEYRIINKVCTACKNLCICNECSQQRIQNEEKRAYADISSGNGSILEIDDFQDEKVLNLLKAKKNGIKAVSKGSKINLKKRIVKKGQGKFDLHNKRCQKQIKKTVNFQRSKIHKKADLPENIEINQNKILNKNKIKVEIPFNNVLPNANMTPNEPCQDGIFNFTNFLPSGSLPYMRESQNLPFALNSTPSPMIPTGAAFIGNEFIYPMNSHQRIAEINQSNYFIPPPSFYSYGNRTAVLNQMSPFIPSPYVQVPSFFPSRIFSNQEIIQEQNRNKPDGSFIRNRVCSNTDVVNIEFGALNPNGPN